LLPGASADPLDAFLKQRTWVDFRSGLDDLSAFKRLVAGIKGEAIEPNGYELPDEPAPYRGLERFEARQKDFFFGREDDIRRLARRLSRSRFVAIVGASGCGKSSLARAGLHTVIASQIRGQFSAVQFRQQVGAYCLVGQDSAGLGRSHEPALEHVDET
jgi:hypothetical protein